MAKNKDMRGTGIGNEHIFRQGLGDPRSGPERLTGLVNRVISGNQNAPVRQYDDSAAKMAENRKRK